MTLLLGPDPEGPDDGGDLGAGARVPHRPRVDHVAEILGRDLERLAVGEEEAHAREDRLVVADRRLRPPVLVAEPAQVAADELPERCLAVRLVLHRLPDDPGGPAERQAGAPSIRTARSVSPDELAGRALFRRGWCLLEKLELAARVDRGLRLLDPRCHARRVPDGPPQSLSWDLPKNSPPPGPRRDRGAPARDSTRALQQRTARPALTRPARQRDERPTDHGLPSEVRKSLQRAA